MNNQEMNNLSAHSFPFLDKYLSTLIYSSLWLSVSKITLKTLLDASSIFHTVLSFILRVPF